MVSNGLHGLQDRRAAYAACGTRLGPAKVEATLTWENGGVETHEGDWKMSYPVRGVEYAWTLDSVRLTDPKAKDLQPGVLLRGRGDLEGAKSVKGSLVLLEPDFHSCYTEWLDSSGIEHFEGKLADLEISLTCTATWQGESVTKHVKVLAKGTRWGDPGQQVDGYHMTAHLPPVPDARLVVPPTRWSASTAGRNGSGARRR